MANYKQLYTEPEDEPDGCDIAVPSGMPVYVTARIGETRNRGAVDAHDISWSASWDDICKNAYNRADDLHDYECGSILLLDGIHRVFMTYIGSVYVDGRVY